MKKAPIKTKTAPAKKMKYQSGGKVRRAEPIPMPEPKKRPGMVEPIPMPDYGNNDKKLGLSDSDLKKLLEFARDRGVLKKKNGGSPSKKMMNGGYSKKKMK